MRLRWLGQAGFAIQVGAVSALFDPWLSPHELRIQPAPTVTDLPDAVDLLLASHEHVDHLDLPSIPRLAVLYPAMRVVVPTPLVARVQACAPALRIIGVQPGDHVDGDTYRVDAVPAWHGVSVADGYSAGPSGRPTPHVGYVLRSGGITVYHAGDTIAAPPLVETLMMMGIDVALLPINGHDAVRESQGIVGNLDALEAAQLAAAIGARVLIPMHYEMAQGNTAPASSVVDAVAELDLPLHVVVLSRGRSIDLGLGGAT